MKTKMLFLPIALGIMLFTLTTGCNQDEDEEITPTPNTTTTESRDKFIGHYNVIDTLFNSTPNLYWYSSYVMVISEHPNDTTKISISNFNNSGQTLTASVSSNIFFASAQPYGSEGSTLSGTGSLNNNKLRFNLVTGGAGDYRQIYGTGTIF